VKKRKLVIDLTSLEGVGTRKISLEGVGMRNIETDFRAAKCCAILGGNMYILYCT
jgi:hypothetical protein